MLYLLFALGMSSDHRKCLSRMRIVCLRRNHNHLTRLLDRNSLFSRFVVAMIILEFEYLESGFEMKEKIHARRRH